MQEAGMWESPYSRIAKHAESIWTSLEIQYIAKQTLDTNTATCHYAIKLEVMVKHM
jgi:hypothetical protein